MKIAGAPDIQVRIDGDQLEKPQIQRQVCQRSVLVKIESSESKYGQCHFTLNRESIVAYLYLCLTGCDSILLQTPINRRLFCK